MVWIDGMVDLAELVWRFFWQLVDAAKLRPALQFFDWIEEGLNVLHGIFHHAGTLLSLVVQIIGLVFTGPNLKGAVTL